MSNFEKLDLILKQQVGRTDSFIECDVEAFGRAIATIENSLVVISYMKINKSMIFAGKFANHFGLEGSAKVDSIWEKEILEVIPEEDRDRKFIAELKYFHFVKHLLPAQRSDYYLETTIKMQTLTESFIRVRHRMYYVYDSTNSEIVIAVCIYHPAVTDDNSSYIINSVTGERRAIDQDSYNGILSRRECQVLTLVEKGFTSDDIAARLFISKHTVSRHRQEIISKLKVKNTIEACKVAKSLNII